MNDRDERSRGIEIRMADGCLHNQTNRTLQNSETLNSKETKLILFLRKFIRQSRRFTVGMQKKGTDKVIIQASSVPRGPPAGCQDPSHTGLNIKHTIYIDPTEVGTGMSLVEVELWKPRNLFVCVSEEREDGERGEREGEGTHAVSLSSGTHRIQNIISVYYKWRKREL